jgi:hypothetical protein
MTAECPLFFSPAVSHFWGALQVKGLTRELEINESYLEKLAEEVRKDLG